MRRVNGISMAQTRLRRASTFAESAQPNPGLHVWLQVVSSGYLPVPQGSEPNAAPTRPHPILLLRGAVRWPGLWLCRGCTLYTMYVIVRYTLDTGA